MNNFEEKIINDIKVNVLKQVSQFDYIKFDYNNKRTLPDEFINKAWATINWDEVIEQVREKLQTKICNSIIGNMETEIKTDIKSLLSIDGVRQKLRVEVYPHLMKVLDGEKK